MKPIIFSSQCAHLSLYAFTFEKPVLISIILIFQGSCEFVSLREWLNSELLLDCFIDNSELGNPLIHSMFSEVKLY